MRLTLDWDNISLNKALKRLKKLKKLFPDKQIVFNISSKKKGFHVIVFDAKISFEKSIELRKKFSDDPKRIKKDLERKKNKLPCNVLFDKKISLKRTKNKY